MKEFKLGPISFQKRKHKIEQKKKDIEFHQVIRDKNAEEVHVEMQARMKKQLENLPRFTYKVTRFYRHMEDLQSTIDKLNNNGIMNVEPKTLTENFIEEIYDTYMILPGEGRKIFKTAVIAGIIGSIAAIFHSSGIITIPILNPISGGGTSAAAFLGFFTAAAPAGTFTAILKIYEPLKNVEPGIHMLTVYGDLEDKKKIKNILNESVTMSV